MMDPLWAETCWSTFKYFIILIVSTYYILCISWIIKCLIIIMHLEGHKMTKFEEFGGLPVGGRFQVNVTWTEREASSYESTVFTIQPATKAQRGSSGIALLFL